MSEVLRYIIEWKDRENVITHGLTEKKYVPLKLHGDTCYKLTGRGVSDYWQCWENETGYTGDEQTDICIIWPREAEQPAKDMIRVGQEKGYQTVIPTAWMMKDIAAYMADINNIAVEGDGKKLYLPSSFKLKDGAKYNLKTLAEKKNGTGTTIADAEIKDDRSHIPKQDFLSKIVEKTRVERNMATDAEIKEAMRGLSAKHNTVKQEEQ